MSQKVYDVLKPTGGFKIADAEDINAYGEALINFVPIILSAQEYQQLISEGAINYGDKQITYDPNRIYFIKREF